MGQRFSDPSHFKDDGMKAAIAACPVTLPRVDRDRLTYPFEVGAGQLWGLVDMTMEGQHILPYTYSLYYKYQCFCFVPLAALQSLF